MFDTAIGITASLAAEGKEVTTADLNISYIIPVDYGQHIVIKTYIVKAGRTIIRLRAEMYCKETSAMVAAATGNWVRL